MSLATADHIELTQGFIDANPVTVSVLRDARTPDGAGGSTKGSASAAGSVTGRLVGRKALAGDGRTVDDGVQNSEVFTFVCLPSEDLRKNDYFELPDGKKYTVQSISTSPPWRLSAGVSESS